MRATPPTLPPKIAPRGLPGCLESVKPSTGKLAYIKRYYLLNRPLIFLLVSSVCCEKDPIYTLQSGIVFFYLTYFEAGSRVEEPTYIRFSCTGS